MIFAAGAPQQAGHRNFTCMPPESPPQVRTHIGLRPCMNAISLDAPNTTPRYRTIFISDLHLGTRGCRIEFLADFLIDFLIDGDLWLMVCGQSPYKHKLYHS